MFYGIRELEFEIAVGSKKKPVLCFTYKAYSNNDTTCTFTAEIDEARLTNMKAGEALALSFKTVIPMKKFTEVAFFSQFSALALSGKDSVEVSILPTIVRYKDGRFAILTTIKVTDIELIRDVVDVRYATIAPKSTHVFELQETFEFETFCKQAMNKIRAKLGVWNCP